MIQHSLVPGPRPARDKPDEPTFLNSALSSYLDFAVSIYMMFSLTGSILLTPSSGTLSLGLDK